MTSRPMFPLTLKSPLFVLPIMIPITSFRPCHPSFKFLVFFIQILHLTAVFHVFHFFHLCSIASLPSPLVKRFFSFISFKSPRSLQFF
jgi:hypothetical protein